jgi:hypothetical protein
MTPCILLSIGTQPRIITILLHIKHNWETTMSNKLSAHKRAMKRFRMICNRSGSVHMFKANNINDARNQARTFFQGPVSPGGVIVE